MDGRTKRRIAPTLSRLSPAPGEQAHICEGLVACGDHDRLVLVAIALACSHAVWAEFYVDAEDAGLCEVLEHAWEFFGGMPRTWLFETKVVLAAHVLELAQGRGATARPYVVEAEGVRWGEWALRCMPRRLLRPHLLRDLELANRSLRVFVEEMLQRRHSGQRGRRVRELLEDERAYLRSAGR